MVSSGLWFPRVASRLALTLFLLLPLAGARGQGSEIAGTMPEDHLPGLRAILATAFERSPQLIEAEYRRAEREARLLVEDAARLPGVSGRLNYASNDTSISSTNSSQSRATGFFYNLSVGQPLFHWGALKNQSEIARIRLAIEQRKFDVAYRALAVVLRKAYLALIVEKARLRHMRASLALLRADLVVLAERKQSGAVAASQFDAEELRLRGIAIETERAEAEFAANRSRFARLAGLADLPEADVPDDIPSPKVSPALATALTATLLRDGAKSTLEYEIHELAVQEALRRHKIEKVRLLPKFSAEAGLSLENSTDVNGNAVNQQGIQRRTISINANWNIFDGFATRGLTRDALAARRLAERTLAARTEEILRDAQILERSLKIDASEVELRDLHHGLAIQGRKRTAEEAALGNLPQGDVDRAQLNIGQAEAAMLAARAVLLGRWSELVALAADDPLLNTHSARHAREKK
ncbi:MAG: TolC family protein [Opitutaceae bacterium]|nr:TolC family protein [Opitutaceae bacterium]